MDNTGVTPGQSRTRLLIRRPFATLPGNGAKLETSGLQEPNTFYQDPYTVPPPLSQAINLSGPQAIVGANTLYTPAALAQNLPNANVGVIDSIDLQLDGIALATNVLWRILICGAPAIGWQITVPGIGGATAAIKSWTKARIPIPLNGSCGVQILNVDGGVYTATTTLYGWYWPAKR